MIYLYLSSAGVDRADLSTELELWVEDGNPTRRRDLGSKVSRARLPGGIYMNVQYFAPIIITITITKSSLSSSSSSSWSWSQVALLKEERSNLLVENEDLCEKVRAAQTLSRKVAPWLDDVNVANHLKAMNIFAPGLCESAPVWDGAGPHQGRVREAAPCLREHQGAHQRHGGQAEARGWWPDWEGDKDTTTTRQHCRLTIWK